MTSLQFAPWSSDIELAFYAALATLKINHDKLDDSARKVLGLYEVRPNDSPERSCRMQIHGSALTTDDISAGFYRAEGIIRNLNTIEDFKNLDRAGAIDRAGRQIWDAIHDGTVYSCPSLLSSFSAISFADLKKYKFTYHFAFPALHSDPPWKNAAEPGSQHIRLSQKETTTLVDSVQTWKYSVDSRQHGFFLAKRVRRRSEGNGEEHPQAPRTPIAEELGFNWVVGSLSSYESGFFSNISAEDRLICFVDPSNYENNPGWALRNLLILIRYRWKLNEAQILCYRDTHLRRDQANSMILKLKSTAVIEDLSKEGVQLKMPKVTGWERNDSGKLSARLIDLSAYLDPQRLADQAVDLNLKLIKWRIAPSIDLDVVKNTKCLLLGAGTLGSYVSRILLGWGVRKITFVDNAKISYSNPVRQPLFNFEDCMNGGEQKAPRAAEALKKIYPGVDATGHVASVPMLGHPITNVEKSRQDFDLLKKLIHEHDVIFLLMDTRESRWLPTVMGKAAGKIVMNAALGFDTFVVMRHGVKAGGPGEEELGCYFCNDVVAPADSLKDATLDQQCTVTRPGVAPLASSLLVEILVSVLQHPLRAHAPATTTNPPASSPPATPSAINSPPKTFHHPLGAVPHTIRGFLSTFSNMPITGRPYDCCSACSDKVTGLYAKDGWAFVERALNERGWVEELSGLAEVQRRAEQLDAEIEWSDDGGDDGEAELL